MDLREQPAGADADAEGARLGSAPAGSPLRPLTHKLHLNSSPGERPEVWKEPCQEIYRLVNASAHTGSRRHTEPRAGPGGARRARLDAPVGRGAGDLFRLPTGRHSQSHLFPAHSLAGILLEAVDRGADPGR